MSFFVDVFIENSPLMSVCVPFDWSLWRVIVAPISGSAVRKSWTVPFVWAKIERGNRNRNSIFMLAFFERYLLFFLVLFCRKKEPKISSKSQFFIFSIFAPILLKLRFNRIKATPAGAILKTKNAFF